MKYSLPLIILLIVMGLLVTTEDKRAANENREEELVESPREESPASPQIVLYPQEIIQGNPFRVSVEGVEFGDIESLTFNNRRVALFLFQNKPNALIGIDLRMQTGSYPLVLTFKSGEKIERSVEVLRRTIPQAPFDIPEKLGGNTPEAQKELVNTLAQEGAVINAIPTTGERLWEDDFRLPLDPPITITDTYGYSRITVGSTISHKGTDFRAEIGTRVYSINSGLVSYVGFLRNYGNTIVLDHGFGLQSIYMHLSEVNVDEGERVAKGEIIGRSGDTGYVLGPHLHLSIKIDKISIDPMKFFEVFGERI